MRRWLIAAVALVALVPATARAGEDGWRGLELRLVPPPGLSPLARCAELAPVLARLDHGRTDCVEWGPERRVDLTGSRPLRLTVSAPSAEDLDRSLVDTVDGLLAGRLGLTGPEARDAGRVLFAAGLPEDGRFALAPTGAFRDRLTGRTLPFDDAFALFRLGVPDAPSPGRAAVELVVGLGAGTVWYWTATSVNAPDWQYTSFGDSLYKKLVTFEAWRFDDNPVHLNSPGHALSGAVYYLLGRSNGLGPGVSFGAAALESTLWELLTEYREIFGINDVILGAFGGVAIGEPMYQLGRFFSGASGSGWWQAFADFFGFPDALHRWATGVPALRDPLEDRFGLPGSVPHRIEFALGGLATERTAADPWRGDLEARFDAELFLLPEHLRPVSVSRLVLSPPRVGLDVDLAYGPTGVLDVRFRANTVLAAWHEQVITDTARGPSGHALLLGLASDFRHEEHPVPGLTDYMGVAGLLGPVVDLFVVDGPWKLRVQAEVYPDFALVRALALPDYAAAHGLAGAKSTLRNQGYYDARGVTAFGRFTLDYGPVGVGAEVTADRFDSIEGLDRFQAAVTDDFHLVDTRVAARVFGRYRVPRSSMVLTLRYEAHHRTGAIREVRAVDDERALSFLMGWSL